MFTLPLYTKSLPGQVLTKKQIANKLTIIGYILTAGKSNFFAHVWLTLVVFMTVWMAKIIWNLIFSVLGHFHMWSYIRYVSDSCWCDSCVNSQIRIHVVFLLLSMLTALLHHYSLIVNSGGQSQIWRMAATTTGRQEFAYLIYRWEDASTKALFPLKSWQTVTTLLLPQQTIQQIHTDVRYGSHTKTNVNS